MENLYESDELLQEYLLFHYGDPEEILPYPFGPKSALGFPRRSISECLDRNVLPFPARALDLGCAVGRSSFELARYCAEVVAIDYSATFIGAANTLREFGELNYRKKIVGEVVEPALALVPVGIDRSRVHFQIGDAHSLPESIGTFDVVHAANILCRMTHPRQLLARFSSLLKPGRQLILTTPNTWSQDHTPRRNWLGGTPDSGAPLDVIKVILDGEFELVSARDMPFLIREHARKFQWSVAQATVWIRCS